MKYIRTKDGIYELEGFGFRYPKDYKKADTIEELCDEFVLYDLDTKRHLKSSYNSQYCKIKLTGLYKEIYGAIWTDKGLIYVAKMNDKGELELL